MDFLVGWAGAAKTVVTATHDLDTVEDIADYCYVFQNGKVVGAGAPREILANTELLESANLFAPAVTRIKPGRHIRAAAFSFVPKHEKNE